LVLGWAAGIPWALGFLGGEFVAALYISGESHNFAAVIYGAGLVLVAELAFWSLDARTRTIDETGLTARRIFTIASLIGGSLCIGLFGAGAAQLSVTGSLALNAVAMAAAILAIGLVAVMTWRIRQ
jgi:hypothetical protein